MLICLEIWNNTFRTERSDTCSMITLAEKLLEDPVLMKTTNQRGSHGLRSESIRSQQIGIRHLPGQEGPPPRIEALADPGGTHITRSRQSSRLKSCYDD